MQRVKRNLIENFTQISKSSMLLCMKEDGMGRKCGTHGREQMQMENWKEKGFFVDQVLDMRIILKWMERRGLK